VNNSIIQSSESGYPGSGQAEEQAPPSTRFSPRRLLFFLRKYWWIPLVTLILTFGVAAAYVRYKMVPNFVSMATMWETEKLQLPEGASFTEDLQNYFGTQMELLQNAGMERRVIARLQAANNNAIPIGEDGKPLKVKISTSQTPKSTIFTIMAVSSNPAYTQAYLDALLNEYLEYKKNVRKVVSGDTLASISELVLRKETDLKEEQAALDLFERTNNLAILQEEGTISAGYLAKLQTELSDLKLESKLLDLTAAQRVAKAAGATNAAESTASLTGQGATGSPSSSAEHLGPAEEIEILKVEREKLSKNLRPKHPKIVKLDDQIAKDEKMLDIYGHESNDQLAASRQSMKTRMDNIMAAIKEWENKIMDANIHIAEGEQLKASVNRTQAIFDHLSGLLQTVDLSRNIDQETLTILDPASPAIRSHSEETGLLEKSAFGGIALGLAIIALIAIRDDRLNSLAEVSERFGDVIVGQVPDMPRLRGATQMPLLEVEDNRDMYAESYRTLRSAIFFMPREGERPKVLLITSAMPDEGKSTIAANLARTLALGGSRVLLVDADLRKGYLHDLLGLRLEPGLSDLLERPDDLESIVQPDALPNLFFLSRGKSVANPGDLFLASRIEELLADLRKKYDYVIIDTTPIFAADDAASLAPKTDGTLFVVRSHFSSAGAVKEALDLLSQRQVRVLGVVFNRVNSAARSYYYYKNRDYYRPKKIA
jgi:succinoglycan biosynthesis transport protein ExoP